jgi:hypothetical protein
LRKLNLYVFLAILWPTLIYCKMNKTFKKAVTVVTATAAALAPWATAMGPVSAAGVAVTATPVDVPLNTATEVTLAWTATGTTHDNGDVIYFTVSPDPGVTLAACTTPTTDIDGNSSADGALTFPTTSTAQYGFTGTVANDTFSVCLEFPSLALPGSYSIAMVDAEMDDYGAALVYVGNDNDVTVTANIAPTLSFNIVEVDDDQVDTNICDLGTVDTTTAPVANATVDGAGECAYALAIGTNAQGGFVAQIIADDHLNSATADLNNITDGAFTAGVEEYGLQYAIPATSGRDPVSGDYDQSVVMSSTGLDFTTLTTGGAVRVPNIAGSVDAAMDFFSYDDGISFTADGTMTDTTRVFHALTVGSGTPAGFYDQVVTYTVTATF